MRVEGNWPDPAEVANAGASRRHAPAVDDVSGMNGTDVSAVLFPRTEADVRRILTNAARLGQRISMRGTQHSMGGHSIAPQGVVVDLKKLNKVTSVNPAEMTATCGPGATWADLIAALNPHGLSPRTMQSYSSFSIGGTLSVNGHGITSDFAAAEAVKEFDVALHDGSMVRRCRLDAPEASPERRLFSLVLGGYGMFGIVTSVTLKVNKNHTLSCETFPVSPAQFGSVYAGIVAASSGNDEPAASDHLDSAACETRGRDIQVKLARLNVCDPDKITMYLFRKTSNVRTVGKLDSGPREIGYFSRMMYKWLAPAFQEMRGAVEEQTGAAMDWGDALDTNSLLHENAEPLAQLSQGFYQVDDTFILQEYFVPCENFTAWVAAAKPIYKALFDGVYATESGKEEATATKAAAGRISLLNTTIRHVKADTITALPYSRVDTFAFVLYYRLPKTELAMKQLQKVQQRFINVTLPLGGTFYLPYLHHYTLEQFAAAYPGVRDFFAAKEEFDPDCRFDSLWLRDYGHAFLSEGYAARLRAAADPADVVALTAPLQPPPAGWRIPCVDDHRRGSYRKLLENPTLRAKFRNEFLTSVFNIKAPQTVYAAMCRAAWNREYADDLEIYLALTRELSGAGPAGLLTEKWKALNQVSEQKAELAGETARIVARLGRLGTIRDYVSVGDHGKMVLTLREALKLPADANVWVVHDEEPPEHSINASVERGSAAPVGEYSRIDYANACRFTGVPDACCDLVTMNQGLHHIPQQNLPVFLGEVVRVLRPGGLFVFREHDATPDLLPMCDIAHSIFNVVTGVSYSDEKTEVRAFRSVAEWREIVQNATPLRDTMQYEMQKTDPTLDEMLCFVKGAVSLPDDDAAALTRVASGTAVPAAAPTPKLPFEETFTELPHKALAGVQHVLDTLVEGLPAIENAVVSNAPKAHRPLLRTVLRSSLAPLLRSLAQLRQQTNHAKPRELAVGLMPEELFAAVHTFEKKVQAGKASPQEALLYALGSKAIKGMLGVDTDDDDDDAATGASKPSDDDDKAFNTPLDEEAVSGALLRVAEAYPDLPDPAVWEAKYGVPRAVADALRKKVPAGGAAAADWAPAAAKALCGKMDDEIWEELEPVLREIAQSRPALTFDQALGRGGGASPWNTALLLLLGSDAVTISRPVLMMSQWYGFVSGELELLWRTAGEMRRARLALKARRTGLSARDQKALDTAFASLDANVQAVTMVGSDIRTVQGVAELIEVTYNGNDVTDVARARLFNEAAGTLLLKRGDLDREFGFGLTKLSKFFYGDRVVKVQYRTKHELPVATLKAMSQTVVDILHRNHVIAAEFGVHGAANRRRLLEGQVFNQYKLAEWLQVDLLKDFGQSLEATPWYRYPFMQTTSKYWTALHAVFTNVWQRHGLQAALLNAGFGTSMVPGVVMAALFGQLKVLALPLLLSEGEAYDAAKTKHRILLRRGGLPSEAPGAVAWPACFEELNVTVERLPQNHELFVLTVPVFRAFSDIVTALAEMPSDETGGAVMFMSIAGHDRVHIKVAALEDALAPSRVSLSRTLHAFGDGVEGITAFSIPPVADNAALRQRLYRAHHPDSPPLRGSPDVHPPLKYASVTVEVTRLAPFLRYCSQERVAVVQIFDYYM